MSVSMVSSSAVGQTYQRPQGPGKEIREGIDSLKKAAESGDMTAVQSAYESLSKLQSDKQGSSSSTTSPTAGAGKDPLSKLLSSVGEALDSGDISQVQQALSKNGPPGGGAGGAGGPGGGAGGPPPNGPPPGEGGGSDELRSTVGSLAQSLQSGDVSGAQESLSALSDMLKSASDSDSEDDGSSTDFLGTLKKNLSSLSSSLSSGDVTGAQSLFASLTPRGSQGVDITA